MALVECAKVVEKEEVITICVANIHELWELSFGMKNSIYIVTVSSFELVVYFANPAVLPTPGKKCVNSLQDILPARKAKLRKKIAKNLDRADVPVEAMIEALDEEELDEVDPDEEEPEPEAHLAGDLSVTDDNLAEAQVVVLEHNEAVEDLLDIM